MEREMAHALHADQALKADRRDRLGESVPTCGRGRQGESGGKSIVGRHGDLLTDLHRCDLLAASDLESECRQPRAALQGGIAVEGSGETGGYGNVRPGRNR
jgi:hypothetical protein